MLDRSQDSDVYRSLHQSYQELFQRFEASKAEEGCTREERDAYREQCERLSWELQQLRDKLDTDDGARRAELDAQRMEVLRLTHVIEQLRLELDESKRSNALVRAM